MIRGGDRTSRPKNPMPARLSREASKTPNLLKSAGFHSPRIDKSSPRLRIFAAPKNVFQPYGLQQLAATAQIPKKAHLVAREARLSSVSQIATNATGAMSAKPNMKPP